MDINKILAQNIKKIRESRNLTLDAASEITGVSRSMLAQVEKGDVNPTIMILWKISNGYRVPFGQLIHHTPPHATLVTQEDNTYPNEDGEGEFKTYLIFPFDDNKRFETQRVVGKPGSAQYSDPHMNGTEEYITVFSGTLEITIDQDVFVLNPGDSIRFFANVKHSYRSIGDTELTYHCLMFYL